MYHSPSSLFAVSLILLVLSVAYYVAFWVWRGQTPGKMIVEIKVISAGNAPLTLNRAMLGFIRYIIVWLLFPMIIFDSRKQGLHDKIANTYVVRVGQ